MSLVLGTNLWQLNVLVNELVVNGNGDLSRIVVEYCLARFSLQTCFSNPYYVGAIWNERRMPMETFVKSPILPDSKQSVSFRGSNSSPIPPEELILWGISEYAADEVFGECPRRTRTDFRILVEGNNPLLPTDVILLTPCYMDQMRIVSMEQYDVSLKSVSLAGHGLSAHVVLNKTHGHNILLTYPDCAYNIDPSDLRDHTNTSRTSLFRLSSLAFSIDIV